MLKAYAKIFLELQRLLESNAFELAAQFPDDFAKVSTVARDKIERECFVPLADICRELNLGSALLKIKYMQARRDWEVEWACEGLEELKGLLETELKSRQFLFVPKDSYWENEMLFGKEVFDKIPEATTDIYEAGSCFAVGRAGGVVYHCMGIMQATLLKIGQNLNCIIDLDVDYWGTVTTKIRTALGALRVRAEAKKTDVQAWAEWKRLEAAYSQLLIDLTDVEKAWRHPSAHYRQQYDQPHAEKVLDKVREFVKHAATLLP